MEQRFIGKIALVTGGATGIGKGVAVRLAQEGAHIVIADINIETAKKTAQEIEALGRRAIPYQINLANIDEIQPLVEKCDSEFGQIDILVNCAGICQSKPLLEVTEDDWDRIININQKATAFMIQKVAAQMIKQIHGEVKATGKADRCYGKIVNFTSISGRHGRALQVHYAASKAAIISITQSTALALAPYNINVNAVSPSVVLTGMWEKNAEEKAHLFSVDTEKETREFIAKIPLNRPGSVEDMANTVAFLCSQDADYITGQTINVDGGFEMN